jgi:hypothetical protein
MNMATSGGTCLYKEARLNIEPAYPGSTISFTLPANPSSTFGPRATPKRTVVTEQSADQDEDAFAKRHLASDGSMFFRRHHEYPRSFLWRILDNRKALEIQSADLDQDFNNKLEANLTLILQFASPIRPFCVAFADSEDRDALTVFVITTANELYTITLHRDFFMRPAASEQEIGDWCKITSPNLLASRIPYRLVAPNVHELLVSLDDGGILYLKKKNKEDIDWVEALYQQKSWSFGSLISWKGQQTVQFDNANLDSTAAAAVSLSPDNQHIFTVCLNHQLRAWNVVSGKPGVQVDLLGDRVNEKTAPYLIGPSQSTLMAVVDIAGGVDGALYHVVTYSPKRHQFKFWGIRDADDSHLGIYDVQSEVNFTPPVDDLMSTTVWTLEEFFITPGPAGWRGAELWIRARSGPSSKVYSVTFDLNDDPTRLANTWQNNWVSVDAGPLTVDGLKQNSANPSELDLELSDLYEAGLTEQWIDFLFYPGRFTVATLETALLIFRRGLDRSKPGRGAVKGSLKERICATIAIFAAPKQTSTIDSDEYDDAVTAQWQAFYGLVKDLHKRRGDSLSLAYDHESDMPWLVLSDYLSAIRKVSDSEVIALNASALSSPSRLQGPLRKALTNVESRDMSRLLNAAATFRNGLPSSFNCKFRSQVESELFQSRSLSVIDRMELLEQNSGLYQQVSEEDAASLVEELGTDVKDITTDTFLRAIQAINQEPEQTRTSKKKQITRFGLSALVTISRETMETHYNVMLDLLVLLLFMLEEDISEDFDAAEIYTEIVNQLKDCTILTWLASTVWAHQTSTGPSSEVLMTHLAETFKNSRKFPITQTVLEGIYGHRSFDVPLPRGLKTRLFTHWTRVWLAEIFKEDGGFNPAVEKIMGILLIQKEYTLALEFSKFLTESTWATYLKGRMHMALNDNTLASLCFQKAAFNLGEYQGKYQTDNVLNPLALGLFSLDDHDDIGFVPETERDAFSNGVPRYYNHILGLFEKTRAFSFAADFARLALRSLKGKVDETLKTELLSRLFSASIETARFDDAYSAMSRQPNASL